MRRMLYCQAVPKARVGKMPGMTLSSCEATLRQAPPMMIIGDATYTRLIQCTHPADPVHGGGGGRQRHCAWAASAAGGPSNACVQTAHSILKGGKHPPWQRGQGVGLGVQIHATYRSNIQTWQPNQTAKTNILIAT